MGNREEIKVGDEIELTEFQDSLLPGSRGIVRSIVDLYLNVEITYSIWDNDGSDDDLHDCCDSEIFSKANGWHVLIENVIKFDQKVIETDSDYICTAMPWEIEKK